MDLPLDIKYKIASFDMDTWIRLSYMDDEFKKFSYGIGRKLFIDLFTVINEYGNCKNWTIFGKRHRFDDLPAVIYSIGQEWYQNGKLHRDNDQPAVININGGKQWYQNGSRHRDNDLPAIIYANGGRCWCRNGKLYRCNDKPVKIDADGIQYRYRNGIFTSC